MLGHDRLGISDATPSLWDGPAPRLRRRDQWFYGLCWVTGALVFSLSFYLTPEAAGVGTHTQLGLPPCGVYELFHKPCPSCGMTTAFALLARGRVWEAVKVQPAGVAVFAAALWLWLYMPIAFLKRRPFDHLFELKPILVTVVGLMVLILAVWAWRLI